ncbi:MAG: HPr(Ser) kinase/phosphatase [Oscillospiraceae bacterium]|nr:HPr(Ser) kinase/phosphatase [Oscillospiraceae bacterium]
MDDYKTVKLSYLVDEMKLKILYRSTDYETKRLKNADVHRPGLQLTGYYNYFFADRIQIIGGIEFAYMLSFPYEVRKQKWDELFSKGIPVIIICHGRDPGPELIAAAEKYDVTVLSDARDPQQVIAEAIRLLTVAMAPRITRHGVLVEVYGTGVFILGESGIGKSETAIELLKRGHRLIADDAVEIKRVDVDKLEGSAPNLIKYYVELRGIGVIDVRRTFGIGAVKMSQDIDLIVKLENWEEGVVFDRLGINESYENILGVDVVSYTVPVRPGRNIAIIIEVAAMNYRQKMMGFNAAQELADQINNHFEESDNKEE